MGRGDTQHRLSANHRSLMADQSRPIQGVGASIMKIVPSVIPAKAEIQRATTRSCRMRTAREQRVAPNRGARVASWILAFARMTLAWKARCMEGIVRAMVILALFPPHAGSISIDSVSLVIT